MRQASAREWNKNKEQGFFSALGASCNVRFAADAAGVSTSAAYKRRQTDAEFRARWAAAVHEGYVRLELALLERALIGSGEAPDCAQPGGAGEASLRSLPPSVLLAMLKMHRDVAREGAPGQNCDGEEQVEQVRADCRQTRPVAAAAGKGRVKVKFGRALVEWFARQPETIIQSVLARMSPREVLKFDSDFESWAQKGQHPPKGEGWRIWLLLAGRGFGKTRAGAEWVHRLARRAPGVRIALVAATLAEARSVMIEGPSGLIAVAANEGVRLIWEPSLGRLSWPGGGTAQAFSGDHADGLRGAEHHFAWCAGAARPAGRRHD